MISNGKKEYAKEVMASLNYDLYDVTDTRIVYRNRRWKDGWLESADIEQLLSFGSWDDVYRYCEEIAGSAEEKLG